MARRVCLDCPAVGHWPRGRCPAHAQTEAQRGYGREHRAARRAWQRRLDAGEHVTCWRCAAPIDPTSWHLGHDDADRAVTRGPECPGCNLSAAGRASRPWGGE